jgi:16S rRNA G966 N2-methylase RsmD
VKAELAAENLIPIRTDVFKYIESAQQAFDFIFADPPYSLPTLSEIPEMIFSHQLLNSEGIFIMEHPKEYDFSRLPYFVQRRVYGAVNFSVFIIGDTL